MDLSALLAREGIEANELDALVEWARQRAAALVSRIEPGSHLAEALGVALEQARDANGAPIARTAGRSGPRPMARAVSKPYLGAAVAAALSGKQEDLDLALETAAAAEAAEPEPEVVELAPVVPEPSPEPEPAPATQEELDDNDPSIGGFSRFAFSFRRRAAEKLAAQEDEANRARQARAEQAAASGSWNLDNLELPAPPSFESKISIRRYHPGGDPGDAEASGLLVLGIPDEEGIDIPVQRPRPRSAGQRASDASQPHAFLQVPGEPREPEPPPEPSQPHAAAETNPLHDPHGMSPLLDDDDSFDLRLDNLEADPPAQEETDDAFDPQASEEDAAPQLAAHPTSGPQRMDSGPLPAAHPSSGPHATGSRGSSPPPPPSARNNGAHASGKPPPPPGEARGRGRGKPPPAPGGARQSSTKVAPLKVSAKKKKVLELSQPVARPVSAPLPAAPSERSGHRPIPVDDEVLASPRRPVVPDYLRDDDE